MTTSDEIQAGLQQASEAVGQALTGANAAKDKAEEMINQMTAMGVHDKIAEYTAVKTAIEELITSLTGSEAKANEVITQARAAAG